MKTKNTKTSKTEIIESTTSQPERIRQRAYEIWEGCGCPHGCETEHWLQAEREIHGISGEVKP